MIPAPLAAVARLAMGAVPLPLYRAMIRRDVLVFLYHVVAPPELPHVRHLYKYKSPEAFERDLAYLKRRFRMVSYDEVASGQAVRGGPAAHVTFDDGYAECRDIAAPILRRLGVPATFFVTTAWIDNRSMFHRNKASLCIEALRGLSPAGASSFLRELGGSVGLPLVDGAAFRRFMLSLPAGEEPRLDAVCSRLGVDVPAYLRDRRPYLDTGQIRSLVSEGFTIGAHSRRHVPLGSLDPPAAEEEILASCRTIREIAGRDPVPFAFPHSADGIDRAFLRRLVSAHLLVGRLFDTHRLLLDDPVIMNRITADTPPPRGRRTNLPAILHAAYREAAGAGLRRMVAGPSRPAGSD